MSINDISNKTIYRLLFGVAASSAAIIFAFQLRTQLAWLVVAFFLAVALDPAVKRIAKIVRSRAIAAIIVLLLLMALLGIIAAAVVPPLIQQTTALLRDLPGLIERIRLSDNALMQLIAGLNIMDELSTYDPAQIANRLSGVGDSVAAVIRGVFGGIIATIATLALTFFMILEGPTWVNVIQRLIPENKREHRTKLARQMYKVITGYVTGRLLLAFSVALTTFIVLSLVGVPYAIPLSIIAGLLDLVPLIGATTGGIIVTVAALFQSVTAALIVAIFYIIYQQFENNVLQPIVDSKTVKLSPLAVLIAGILGISMAGLLGALLAIPAAGCAQIIVKDYIRNRRPYR